MYEKKAPKNIRQHVKQEEYEKCQKYARARSQFGFLSEFLGFVVMIVVWSMGWPADIWAKSDMWVRTFKDIEKKPVYHDWLNGMIFSICLGLIDSIIELPLSLYSQFSIEEQHGFNK